MSGIENPPLGDLRDEVAEKITVKELLGAYGVKYRKGGGRNELQAKECPRRRDHGDYVFRFNESSKRWQCFTCAAKGDAFTYVAEMEGLDCKRDWPEVLARAARIAGVTPSAEPPQVRQRRIDELRERRAAREQAEHEQAEVDDHKAITIASAYWRALPARHPDGERYLRRRGFTEADIERLSGRVRFDRADLPFRDGWSSDGAPSLAIYDLRGRGVAGVVRRRLPEEIERDGRVVKAPTLTGCQGSGAMGSPLEDITRSRDVVITEGIADTITAMVAWPGATVIGANGIGPLPTVIAHAARLVRERRGRMLLVPHADDKRQGGIAATAGMRAATSAGLRPGFDVELVELVDAKDLNDAWTSGWRPYEQ